MSENIERDFFKLFIKDLNTVLTTNDNTVDQKKQVEKLMKLENQFRKSLWKFPVQTREVYKKFILKVVVEDRNILSSRPYFREKSPRFNEEISPLIKTGKVNKLRKFHINFNLINYIRENWIGALPTECENLYQQIKLTRKILVETNLPLAINRAKLFHRKVPESHISLDDMIGIASMGLIIGIDKFVGPYTKVFRGVAIGYMTRDLMEDYSSTLIYLYPSDKQLLYRANTIKNRQGIEDTIELAKAVSMSLEEDKKNGKKPTKSKVSSNDLSLLMMATNVLSESVPMENEGDNPISLYDTYSKLENDSQMEERIGDRQAMYSMLKSIKMLGIIEQKIIKMKGVKL